MNGSNCVETDSSDQPNGSTGEEENSASLNLPKMPFSFSSSLTLEQIREMQSQFSNARNWQQFHTPRNLLLALVGEVGELAELFQWKGEVKEGLPDWDENERRALGQELSDVLIYLVRLADRCHIDLPVAVVDKFKVNENKYPVDKVYGCSKKYDQYHDQDCKMNEMTK